MFTIYSIFIEFWPRIFKYYVIVVYTITIVQLNSNDVGLDVLIKEAKITRYSIFHGVN